MSYYIHSALPPIFFTCEEGGTKYSFRACISLPFLSPDTSTASQSELLPWRRVYLPCRPCRATPPHRPPLIAPPGHIYEGRFLPPPLQPISSLQSVVVRATFFASLLSFHESLFFLAATKYYEWLVDAK